MNNGLDPLGPSHFPHLKHLQSELDVQKPFRGGGAPFKGTFPRTLQTSPPESRSKSTVAQVATCGRRAGRACRSVPLLLEQGLCGGPEAFSGCRGCTLRIGGRTLMRVDGCPLRPDSPPLRRIQRGNCGCGGSPAHCRPLGQSGCTLIRVVQCAFLAFRGLFGASSWGVHGGESMSPGKWSWSLERVSSRLVFGVSPSLAKRFRPTARNGFWGSPKGEM